MDIWHSDLEFIEYMNEYAARSTFAAHFLLHPSSSYKA